ncbi:MAG: TolC family protein [Candidatus Omnitrophica bacterium]|nr:TolC family protein [Candidatus Omnitrophota bacterium]
MKNTFFTSILFILILPVVLYAENLNLTLDVAIALALRENRDILLKKEEVVKAQAKIAESKASFYPSFSLSASVADTRGSYSKDLIQETTQATLRQYLYKGGKTINTIKYNEYGFQAAQAVLDKTKLDTIYNVHKSFYTLLLAEELSILNKGILQNSREHLRYIRAKYQNGEVPESDIIKSESSLENVRQAYEASLNQLKQANLILISLLYLDQALTIKPWEEFRFEPKEMAYDLAFLKAMQQRPEISQYEAQVEMARKNIEINKAENRPNIYASWDYYSRSHTAASTSRGWNDYNVIGVTFSWPIFDGWLAKSKVEQAIVDLKEAGLNRDKIIKDIAQEVKSAYLDLKNAISRMVSIEAQVGLYQNTLQEIEQKYTKGITSSLGLDDARLGLEVSLYNKKQAVYDYIMAKVKFDKATGGLL